MNLFKTSLLATALIAGGAIAPANAADNMTFNVNISIAESCNVTSTETIAFGSVLPTAGTASAQGDVAVQCTVGTTYDLALNAGLNGNNDINARKMANAVGNIAYQLYQDTAGTVVWGETAGASGNTATGIGFGIGAPYDQVHTVHAVATIAGTEPVGSYSDTITATVTF